MLLVRHHDAVSVDPTNSGQFTYWVPPGGGVDDGESFERAAIRELEEETGVQLSEVGPQIWARERELIHKGEVKRHEERYFVAWAESSGVLRSPGREGIEAVRWWSLDDLRRSLETFLPENFAELIEPVMAGDIPSAPIEIS